MKANMIFYAVSTLCFYVGEIFLMVTSADVMGMSILCLALILMAMGVVCHCADAHRIHTEGLGQYVEAAAAI